MTNPIRARLTACAAFAAFAAGIVLAPHAFAQDHTGHEGHTPPSAADTQAMEAMEAEGGHAMESPLGPYAMMRDASGTAWQPDVSPHAGVMKEAGDWMLMGHVLLNLVYDHQSGPRGDDMAFGAGMIMGMAQRPLGSGTLGLRAMLSPDPFMGKSGYPLLLAAGETANGTDNLVDRQHPHDLFMELSASYSHPIGERASAFVYVGLPGEPAFGPPAFMHRQAAMDSPEAPITHHWLDSTHITFGVVTAGVTLDRVRLEASAFRGREPDQHRYDIETGALDSASARVSFNPTPNWSLQASYARIESPEQLEPDQDERRVSLSALYARPFGDNGMVSATLAWARKDRVPGEALHGWLGEAALAPDDRWTLFARAEQVEADELGAHHGPAYTVRKLSVGAIYDFRVAQQVKLGVGGLVSGFDVPEPLGTSYGSPTGAMAFVRLKIG